MAISRNLIANDIGSYNSWPPKRIGIKSDGTLWCVYYDTATAIRTAYSSDSGSSWTEESGSPFLVGASRNPSLNIDGNDNVLLSITNPSLAKVPKYNIKSGGSWGSEESVSSNSNASISQILSTSGNVPYCVWRYAPSGSYTQMVANKRIGSWGTPSYLTVGADWTIQSLAACMDGSDNLHAIWRANSISSPSTYSIQTAYWNGTSWSSIITIETFTPVGSTGVPIIRLVGNTLVALWSRDGVGVNTSYNQIRCSLCTVLGSWGSVENVTDYAGHHYDYDATEGSGPDIYVVYTEYGADPGNSTIYNLVSKQWSGSSWISRTLLTEESVDQRFVSIINDGSNIHIIWRETSTTSMYHGTFVSIQDANTREIYDYVDTVAADVDVTLTLDPQVVIPEVGGKGDVIHLADDDSEERVGLTTDFIFFITIRYDLLNEADVGTLLDIWSDTAKGDGRKNSWKFNHPDGHTYVVRFDTDLTRLMSPTYYTVKNIRLKILGRIAD